MDIRITDDTKLQTPAAPASQPAETPAATPADAPSPRPRSRRGFAAMDPNLVKEICRKGGKAAHEAGKAHEFTSEEARAAGRKGGLASHAKRRTAPTA